MPIIKLEYQFKQYATNNSKITIEAKLNFFRHAYTNEIINTHTNIIFQEKTPSGYNVYEMQIHNENKIDVNKAIKATMQAIQRIIPKIYTADDGKPLNITDKIFSKKRYSAGDFEIITETKAGGDFQNVIKSTTDEDNAIYFKTEDKVFIKNKINPKYSELINNLIKRIRAGE